MRRPSEDVANGELLALINRVPWYHSFEIAPGVVTPGTCPVDSRLTFERFGLPMRLAGKRILEIGTWDGPYAFELESRGADVVATDIHDPDGTGFNTARRILSSRVRYVRTSVYDLKSNLDGKFDIVLFMGVFYHLKYPVLALEQIRDVLEDEGQLLFEGECFSHYAETSDSRGVRNRLLLALLAYSNIPVSLFYAGSYKNDASNWHVPNVACLREWMTAAGLRVTSLETSVTALRRQRGWLRGVKRILVPVYELLFNDVQRGWGTAVKVGEDPAAEHEVFEREP